MTQSLRAVLERYVARPVNRRASSAAQRSYSLSVLEKHASRVVTLRDCDIDFLCGWIRALLKSCSQATVKGHRGNIVTLLRFAQEEGLISRVPKVPTIRV